MSLQVKHTVSDSSVSLVWSVLEEDRQTEVTLGVSCSYSKKAGQNLWSLRGYLLNEENGDRNTYLYGLCAELSKGNSA